MTDSAPTPTPFKGSVLPAPYRDGGPAFPTSPDHALDGMSLRDYFAAQALAGYLAGHAGDDTPFPNSADAAKSAFLYADAMLRERRKIDG